jgi:hypothetical protein
MNTTITTIQTAEAPINRETKAGMERFISSGNIRLIQEWRCAELLKKRLCSAILSTFILFGAGAAHADVVTDWNAIMEQTVAPTDPFLRIRSAAITQLAVFEAVNAIVLDYEPYLGSIVAPPGASPKAAAIAAAHRALVALHPGSASELDALRARSLAAIPDGPAKNDGIAVGEAAANAILALRADDGSDKVVPYTPGTKPGDWRPTPPNFLPAFRPGLGEVATFAIENGAQFRLGPPPALHSDKYARDYDEVKKVGDVNSTARPQDRTDVARFYAVTEPVPIYNPAARRVLEEVFGADGHSITLTNPLLPSVVLHYKSWEQITNDIDEARIYGGVHYRFDQEAAARQGRRVGAYILRHKLRPVRKRLASIAGGQ